MIILLRFPLVLIGFLVLTTLAGPAHGQGLQTGVIAGVIESADGAPLPGVTVTATSPNLQGSRTVATDTNGVYVVRGLPPGVYDVVYEIPSFQAASRGGVQVTAGGLATLDLT